MQIEASDLLEFVVRHRDKLRELRLNYSVLLGQDMRTLLKGLQVEVQGGSAMRVFESDHMAEWSWDRSITFPGYEFAYNDGLNADDWVRSYFNEEWAMILEDDDFVKKIGEMADCVEIVVNPD